MALDAATPRAIFLGDDTTFAFSLVDFDGNPIAFVDHSEIKVGVYDVATDAFAQLIEGAEYNLAGTIDDEIGYCINGEVTLTDVLGVPLPLATGKKLVIWRETVLDQPTVFGTATAFSGVTHTALANRNRRIDQELEDQITRALKVAVHEEYFEARGKRIAGAADPVADQDLVTKAYGDLNYGGAVLASAAASAAAAAASASNAHTSEGNAEASEDAVREMYEQILANYVAHNNAATDARENLVLDSLNGAFNSATKTFNLKFGGAAVIPRNAASVLVFLNGVYQYPTTSYSVADDKITFEQAPDAGDNSLIVLMMNALPSRWRNAWASGTDYAADDLVKHEGDVYISKARHTSAAGNEPGVGGSWGDFWALFIAGGVDGDDGREIELQKTATHVQWRYIGAPGWTNLFAFADIAGEDGREIELQTSATYLQWRYVGDPGWTSIYDLSLLEGDPGNDGREIELQKSATHVQWRYVGAPGWTNVVALSDITGPPGADAPGAGDMMKANNLSDLLNAATARQNLGLEIGVNVQGHDNNLDSWATVSPGSYLTIADADLAYQPIDTDLSAIAALSTTPFGRSLLTLANSAAARVSLGVRTAILDSIAAGFDGLATAFALKVSTAAFAPRDAYGMIVILNGVLQVPGDAYTVAGSTITFAAAPDSGDTCVIWAVST